MHDLTVALAQMAFKLDDVPANLAKVTRICREAAAQAVSLVVFPEAALTGSLHYLAARSVGGGRGVSLPGPETDRIAELCQELGICVVAGTVEADAGQQYNSACVVTPEGYQGRFRKLFSPPEEREYYVPGDAAPVFTFNGWKLGIGICYDIYFPELARIYALKGADAFLVPTGGTGLPPEMRHQRWWKPWFNLGGLMKICPARALDNTLYVVVAVAADAGGGSVVVDPAGEQIAHGGDAETLVVVRLQRQLLDAARARSAWPRSWTYLPDLHGSLYRQLAQSWRWYGKDRSE